jgi:hypothetical protein
LDPVIAIIPKYVEPTFPKAIEPQMTSISFFRSVKVEEFNVTEEWILRASEVNYPIKVNQKWQNWIKNLGGLQKEYLDLANKVLGWLPTFLNSRILLNGFGVGKHWVWTAFSHIVSRIVALACLADHQTRALAKATVYDSYLNKDGSVFPVILEYCDWTKCHGCYIQEDSRWGELIRAGMTVQGFVKRQKEHKAASGKGQRALYRAYPHPYLEKEDSPSRAPGMILPNGWQLALMSQVYKRF